MKNTTEAQTTGLRSYFPTLGWGANTKAVKTDAAKTDAEATTGGGWRMPWNWGRTAAPTNGASDKTAHGQKTAEAPSSEGKNSRVKTGDKATRPSLFYTRSMINPLSMWRSKYINPDHEVSKYYPDAREAVEKTKTEFQRGRIGMATAVGRLSRFRTATAANSDEDSYTMNSVDWVELVTKTLWPYADDEAREEFAEMDAKTYNTIISNIIDDDTKKTGQYSIRDVNWAYETRANRNRQNTLVGKYDLAKMCEDLQTVITAVKNFGTRLGDHDTRLDGIGTILTGFQSRLGELAETTLGQTTVGKSSPPTIASMIES